MPDKNTHEKPALFVDGPGKPLPIEKRRALWNAIIKTSDAVIEKLEAQAQENKE